MNYFKIAIVTLITMVSMTGFAQERQDDSQAVLNNIFSRKSVRSYTDEPVTPEQVETLLKAAMAAPSGRNLQAWRFVVVTRREIKEKLAVGFNKMIATAPVLIVVCGLTTQKTGDANNNWTADCAAATENLLDWVPFGRPLIRMRTGWGLPSRFWACPTMSNLSASFL